MLEVSIYIYIYLIVSHQRKVIISLRRWLTSVLSANMLISYCTYTAASRTLKNMNTDSTKHDLTYTTELHSQMHHESLDTRYAEGHFLTAKASALDRDRDRDRLSALGDAFKTPWLHLQSETTRQL